MTEPTNYPDVLGYISGGARMDFGPLQAVAAVRPNPAKAGRLVEVLVILQSAIDTTLEVLVVMTVPERDLAGKNARFVAKVQRLAVGMQPSEVGVLALPLLTQPTTAPGVYRISLQITAKASNKGSRTRSASGGGAFYMGSLPRKTQINIDSLRGLRYFGGDARRSLFGGTSPLEVAFKVEAGDMGTVTDNRADYQTLWTRRDLREDPRIMLDRHKDALKDHVLPALDRTRLLEPLTNRTVTRFRDAYYDLTEVEASLIARVMVHILEYACTGQLSYGRTFEPRPDYEVDRYIDMPLSARPPIKLRWLSEILTLLDEDERVARFISKFLPERAYDALLRDVLTFSLHTVESVTGQDLGTEEELEKFADEWMDKLLTGGPLLFEDVYLPLMLAGIAIHDEVILPDENVKDLQGQLQRMVSVRKEERTERNTPLFDMTREVLEKSLLKYGVGLL